LAWKYPFYSPYSFSGNQVIATYEFEGLEPTKSFNYGEATVTINKQGKVWVITEAEYKKAHAANAIAQRTGIYDPNPGGEIQVVYYTTVKGGSIVEYLDGHTEDYTYEKVIANVYTLLIPDLNIEINAGDDLAGDDTWEKANILLFGTGENTGFGTTKTVDSWLQDRTKDWDSGSEKLIVEVAAYSQKDKFTIKDKNGNVIIQTDGILNTQDFVIDNKYGNPSEWTYEVTNDAGESENSLYSVEVHNAQKKETTEGDVQTEE